MTDRITQRMVDALNRVPGYTGYRSKEDRRDADRRVREHIAGDLDDFARRVEGIAADRATARDLNAVRPAGDLGAKIRLLRDRVMATTYGYGGLFGDRDVDEVALDQLREFDAGLLERVAGLESAIAAVESAPDDAGRTENIRAAGLAVDGLTSHLRERDQVIETGKPSRPTDISSPLDVLAPAPSLPPPPPAAEQAAIGDAVSLAGANFVVDAVIEVDGPEAARLVRIETSPPRWLLRTSGTSPLSADLTVDEGGDAASAPTSGAASRSRVTGVAGRSGERQLTFTVTRDGPPERPVRVVLDWGTDAMRLAGTILESDDVEIYRRSENV